MIYKFESNEAYYDSVTNQPEYIRMEWDTDTGALTDFELLHGPDKSPRILSNREPSIITWNAGYYEVDLRITTSKLLEDGEPANLFKGKIRENSAITSGAILAVIWEGAGASWYVAKGFLT